MVIPKSGDVVVLPFPFSDLSESKVRPAVVLARANQSDWILCQITSNPYGDAQAIVIDKTDFEAGMLRLQSYARPSKLFTANEGLIISIEGTSKARKVERDSKSDHCHAGELDRQNLWHENDITLGEICNTLRGVWGDAKRVAEGFLGLT